MTAAAVAIFSLVKNADFVAIEAIEATLGAHPDKSVFVVRDSITTSLRKSLPDGAMVEPYGLVLSNKPGCRPGKDQTNEIKAVSHKAAFLTKNGPSRYYKFRRGLCLDSVTFSTC